MKIKAIIFGSTGMIGQAVLLECLENNEVETVLVINRHSCNKKHLKLKEIIHYNLFDLTSLTKELTGYNTCFYCLGKTSVIISENEYLRITYELTIHAASILLKINKDFTFCYISGAKADSSENSKIMQLRVKGKTENALLAMPFKKAYMFRPGYIQPMQGIKSRSTLTIFFYAIFKPMYFILKHFKSFVTNTNILGKAMINALLNNYEGNILESKDINRMGK